MRALLCPLCLWACLGLLALVGCSNEAWYESAKRSA